MKSSRAKVLHEVQSKPMILHVMDTIKNLSLDHTYVVVGHQKEKVAALLDGYQASCIIQEEQLGTGHAVLCAEGHSAYPQRRRAFDKSRNITGDAC
jgi:bifunctional UDP-N-acetylglucosamine pyrophosphorylase/glucosamine-1-phosphate N-acetyltransferase